MTKPNLLSYDDFQWAGLFDIAIACGENAHTWDTTWQDILGSAMMSDDEDVLYGAYIEWFKLRYEE